MTGLLSRRRGAIVRRVPRAEWSTVFRLVLCLLVAAIPFHQARPAGALGATLFGLIFLRLAFADLKAQTIPNRIVLPALLLALALGVARGDEWSCLAGAATAFSVMFGMFLVSRGALGAGDVKMAALVGAVVGFPAVLYAGTVMAIAGGVSGLLLLISGRAGRTDALPYGPFIALGALAALLR